MLNLPGDSFRWGFSDVLQSGAMGYTTRPTPYLNGQYAQDVQAGLIDVTIHISCDYKFFDKPLNAPAREAIKGRKEMQVICMQHELENFGDDERKFWLEPAREERLQFLVLSHHVKDCLRSSILKFAEKHREPAWQNVPVESMVPVRLTFSGSDPVDRPATDIPG